MTSSSLFQRGPHWNGFWRTMAFHDANQCQSTSSTSKLAGRGRSNHPRQFISIHNIVLAIDDTNGHPMPQSTQLSTTGLRFRELLVSIRQLSVLRRMDDSLRSTESTKILFVLERLFFVQRWQTGVDDGTSPSTLTLNRKQNRSSLCC